MYSLKYISVLGILQAFADEALFAVLAGKLGELLQLVFDFPVTKNKI